MKYLLLIVFILVNVVGCSPNGEKHYVEFANNEYLIVGTLIESIGGAQMFELTRNPKSILKKKTLIQYHTYDLDPVLFRVENDTLFLVTSNVKSKFGDFKYENVIISERNFELTYSGYKSTHSYFQGFK